MASTSSVLLGCVFLASILVCLFLSGTEAATWSYLDDETGPNNWTAEYPGCAGMKQSPINIVSDDATERDLGEFTLVGFGADDEPQDATMTVHNNGHTVEVPLQGDYLVSGASLGSTAYKAVQFHFHWGSINSRGSEHTLNGMQYPGELHIVAYNTKYASFFASLPFEDALTVLGFFIDVQAEDNPALTPLINAISMVQFDGDSSELSTPVVFKNILPGDLSTFYRYSGSLTTPTCNEIVTWNVFPTPIMLSEAQLMVFRKQYLNEPGDEANITLTDTFRPVQPLNGRKVYVNPSSANPSSANPSSANPSSANPSSANPSSASGLCASTSLVAMVIVKVLASVLAD